MSTEYDGTSKQQFFGGVGYGSGYSLPWSGEVIPVGVVKRVLIQSGSAINDANAITSNMTTVNSVVGSVAPAGTVTPEYFSRSFSVSSSTALSGALSLLINKTLIGTLDPKKNYLKTYGDDIFYQSNDPIANNPILLNKKDGLIKSTSTSRSGVVESLSSLIAAKRPNVKANGSVAPSSTIDNTKYTMWYLNHPDEQTPIEANITPSGSVAAVLQDPNDLNNLVLRNSQKVTPRVKAYWANGRFTKNLFGLSSSDIYQTKTLDLKPVLYWNFNELGEEAVQTYLTPASSLTAQLTNAAGTTSYSLKSKKNVKNKSKRYPNTTSVLDRGLNNYDGTYVGARMPVPGPLKGNDANKESVMFSGSSYVYLQDNDDLNFKNNFQIECWLQINSTPSEEMYVCSKGQGIANIDKQYALSIKTDKKIKGYIYIGGNEYSVTSAEALTLNNWYHVIFSIKGTEIKIIINGVESNSTTVSEVININVTSGRFELGRLSKVGNNFNGSIGEFALYNSAIFSGGGSAYARYRSGVNTGVSQWYDKFYPEQLMNGYSRVSYVWGVSDTKKLNGQPITANGETYVMESDNSYRYEHGWWSRSVSDANGRMNFVETVVCEFDDHPCNEIDVYTSEFFAGVKEIDIYYKDNSDNWIQLTEGTIIERDKYAENSPLPLGNQGENGFLIIRGVRVDIKSVWAGEDVARIEEIDPTYITNISDDIISFNIQTDRENFDSNIPIGSANANSLSIELSNIDLEYSVYNQQSKYYNLILPDVKFEVELAWFGAITNDNPTGMNYKKLGTYWADEWQESSDGMTVSVQARDYSKFLQETTSVGNVWLNVDGPEAIANLLKETNFPAFDIKTDLPYDTTCLKNNAAGLWMLHESNIGRYSLSWNEENIKQTAYGELQHGPNNSFTLMFWINSNQSRGIATVTTTSSRKQAATTNVIDIDQTLFHFYKTATDYMHIYGPRSLKIDIAGKILDTGLNIADDRWNQVTISSNVTVGASSKTVACTVYINGVQKYYGTVTTPTQSLTGANYGLSLGAPQTSKGSVATPTAYKSNQFVGELAYISLWNQAMTSAEVQDVAFREIVGLEKNLLLAFTGYNGDAAQIVNANYLISKAYSQDYLKLINVSFAQTGFMQFKDFAGSSNATGFGGINYSQTDAALSLEPYNKSALLTGDKPTAIFFTGQSSAYIKSANSYKTSINGDIDIFLQISLPTLKPATEQILYSQSKPSTNQRSLVVALDTTGAIKFYYSTNGSSYTTVSSSVPLQSKDLRPEEKFWLRVSHKVDNQVSGNDVSIYISRQDIEAVDIISWELVETKTTAGALASGRYNSNAGIVIGANDDAGGLFNGYLYKAYVTSGIDSADSRININDNNLQTKLDTSIVDSENNIWSINKTVLSTDIGSYIFIPPNDNLNVLNQSFSISLWAKPIKNETYILLCKDFIGSLSQNTFSLVLTETGSIGVVKTNGSVWNPKQFHNYGTGYFTSDGKISINSWNFISITYDASNEQIKTLKIYVNGELLNTYIINHGANSDFVENNAPWLIGANGELNFFAGSGVKMNGLAIFDVLLTQSQITDIYRSGASLINNRFPVIWTEESETLWDAMLAVSTGDLGTFYFDYDNKFIYSNALNNYSNAYKEFTEPQWYFDENNDIINGSQNIALQTNKIVVRLNSDGIDFNKKETLWTAPDGLSLTGSELDADLSATFTEYLAYRTKAIQGTGEPVMVPDFLPSGYVKIDEEIIFYEKKDKYRLYNLKRGQFNTVAANHVTGDRIRETRAFSIDYSSKPAIVLQDPFITAVTFEKTVDIDSWRPDAFGAKLVISRNEVGDPYLVQVLSSTDPLNNLVNLFAVSGIIFSQSSSKEVSEFESSEYADNIRRYGVKQVEITNRFINSHYAAKKYADYFLKHFSEPVSVIQVGILGNPQINLGDRVRIYSFNRMAISSQDYWVESNNINYNGGIDQTLVLRKAM